jgi:hypothetical protein
LELRAIPLVVLVQQTLDEKKSKHVSLVQENGFGLALLHSVTEAGKLHSKSLALVAIDWLDGLIAPGGLLLVVSNLL